MNVRHPRRAFAIATAALVMLGASASALAQPKPDATIEFDIFKAGFIVGGSGGSGTLTYQGKTYPLTIGGVSLGATIGVTKAELVGEVYNLKSVGDIAGTYTAAQAGFAVRRRQQGGGPEQREGRADQGARQAGRARARSGPVGPADRPEEVAAGPALSAAEAHVRALREVDQLTGEALAPAPAAGARSRRSAGGCARRARRGATRARRRRAARASVPARSAPAADASRRSSNACPRSPLPDAPRCRSTALSIFVTRSGRPPAARADRSRASFARWSRRSRSG